MQNHFVIVLLDIHSNIVSAVQCYGTYKIVFATQGMQQLVYYETKVQAASDSLLIIGY